MCFCVIFLNLQFSFQHVVFECLCNPNFCLASIFLSKSLSASNKLFQLNCDRFLIKGAVKSRGPSIKFNSKDVPNCASKGFSIKHHDKIPFYFLPFTCMILHIFFCSFPFNFWQYSVALSIFLQNYSLSCCNKHMYLTSCNCIVIRINGKLSMEG